MKTRKILVLGLGLAATWQAWAVGPINPARLGAADAVLNYCGQINPTGVHAYQTYRASLISQQSADSIALAVKSAAYKQKYAEIGSALSAATPAWAIQACVKIMTDQPAP
ncbi:MAG TPA: hypothetical protein VK130_02475 [Steroidobacteraceae bacterium]|nr:hypothetical protein [Steroidobacteraceae bacterium]